MDQENLIECVKRCESLYVTSHPKYSDAAFKKNAWNAIAKELDQSAAVCKKTWMNLRDSYRRATKKKRDARSGQPATKMKKWKFEEEMSFLLAHMHERERGTSVKEVSDDDPEKGRDTEEPDENVYEENEADAEEPKNRTRNERGIKSRVSRNTANKSAAESESASALVTRYLPEERGANARTPPVAELGATDMFFSSISATVKNLSPYYRNIAKARIFAVANDLEMKQIQEQSCAPRSTVRRAHCAPVPKTSPSQTHEFCEAGRSGLWRYSPSPSASPLPTTSDS